MQRVLSQRITHATYPDISRKIFNERSFRGGKAGPHDGNLYEPSTTAPTVPSTIFMNVRSESEGLIFPFSQYPTDLRDGANLSIVTLDMEFLKHDEFRMYHNHTVRMTYDPRITPIAQSQVVFAHRDDEEAVEFAERKLTPLDKKSNAILVHSEENGE